MAGQPSFQRPLAREPGFQRPPARGPGLHRPIVYRPIVFGVAWSLIFALASCSGSDTSPAPREAAGAGTERPDVSAVVLRDDGGREIALEVLPERIVSLVPSATEILVALGQESRLVARTDYDTGPEVADLPSVGGGLGASVERIVQLEPDLVVRFLAESDPETPRQLEAAGIEHLAIRPDRIEDVRRIVVLLGRVVDERARADSLVAEMDAGLARVSESVAGLLRPNVALLGGNPPSAAGPDTFLHELLVLAGGRNAFEDLDALYAPISLEEVLRRDVDLILAPAETPIPAALSGIPTREIPVQVLLPGLRVVDSAELLAGLLHPDAP